VRSALPESIQRLMPETYTGRVQRQTKDEIQKVLRYYFNQRRLEETKKNRELIADEIDEHFDGVYNLENLAEAEKKLKTKFSLTYRPPEPLPELITTGETLVLMKQLMNAHSWILDSGRNGKLIADAFFTRVGPKRGIAEMYKALELVKHQLDIVREDPPPPPKTAAEFYTEEYESNLQPWQLPYPQSEFALRRATLQQVRDYSARLVNRNRAGGA
jgi:hypothetical protein